MKDRYSLTLYTYDPGMTIQETTLKQKPYAPETSNARAIGQDIIVRLLGTYGFLTANLIKRCLCMKGHRRIVPEKSLAKMQIKGRVLKHTIHIKDSDKQDIDIYTLSAEMRSELKQQGFVLIHYKYDMSNIPYVLERLSAIQWHIACLEARHTREAAYHWRVATEENKTALIPSLTEVVTFRNRKLYVIGIPAPKGKLKEDLMKFLLNVFIMEEYFNENRRRFKSRVYVLICEDDKQAEDICRYITNIRETSGLYFLYTNDEATQEGMDPLSLLYELKLKDKKIERRIVSIS